MEKDLDPTLEDILRFLTRNPDKLRKALKTEALPSFPAIKISSWLGNYLFPEVLVDIGADCIHIDMETYKEII